MGSDSLLERSDRNGRTARSDRFKRIFKRNARSFKAFFAPVMETRLRQVAALILVMYGVLAIVGPYLPIPGPYEAVQSASGGYARTAPPSSEFIFGTTNHANSVFAQTIHSFRVSVIVAFTASAMVVTIGVNVGLVSGYFGGYVDELLMGITDLVYGLPFYPFAIVFVGIAGRGIETIIVVVGLILWRTIARVTRSETLSLKEQEFVKSARAAGTSHAKTIYLHILPNITSLIVVYLVFGATWAVLIEASLSFLGLGDPAQISWGVMLHGVFNAGQFSKAWWWVLAPAVALWLFIWSLFVIARALEESSQIDNKGLQ